MGSDEDAAVRIANLQSALAEFRMAVLRSEARFAESMRLLALTAPLAADHLQTREPAAWARIPPLLSGRPDRF